MPNKSFSFISLFLLMVIALFGLMGCNSDANNKNSITSGTTTGFGGSGGTAAQVTVVAGNSQIANGGTTPITVIVTDSSRKTNRCLDYFNLIPRGIFCGNTRASTTTNVTTTSSTITSATI